MSKVTFRDFAGAIMATEHERAAQVLSALLGLDAPTAATATSAFVAKMAADPQFVIKAMGLRAVVEQKDHDGATGLLRECFDLAAEQAAASATVLLAHD